MKGAWIQIFFALLYNPKEHDLWFPHSFYIFDMFGSCKIFLFHRFSSDGSRVFVTLHMKILIFPDRSRDHNAFHCFELFSELLVAFGSLILSASWYPLFTKCSLLLSKCHNTSSSDCLFGDGSLRITSVSSCMNGLACPHPIDFQNWLDLPQKYLQVKLVEILVWMCLALVNSYPYTLKSFFHFL